MSETPKRPPFKAWQSMSISEKFLEVRWNVAVGSASVRETQFLLERYDELTTSEGRKAVIEGYRVAVRERDELQAENERLKKRIESLEAEVTYRVSGD